MKRIFVSGPISDGGRLGIDEQSANVLAAEIAGLALIRAGYAPLIPHLCWYMVDAAAVDHAAWLAIDLAWLERADAVLRLPGASVGADREVARARELGIPVAASLEELAAALAGRAA